MKIPCSAASLLALFWALPGQCTVWARCRTAHWPLPCLARHTVHAPARGQEHSSMGMQQGQPRRLPLAIPAVITWQPRANFPIDHVWRVGEKNNLPHSSSNSSEPSFQRLCHEQNWKQDHSLLLPKSSAFPNHYVLWLDPALTAQQPVGEGLVPSAQPQTRAGKCAQRWAVHWGLSPLQTLLTSEGHTWTKHRRCQSNACSERQQKLCSCHVLHGSVRIHCY